MTLTTPSGLDIRLHVGTIFKTAKGTYIIAEMLPDANGEPQAIKAQLITDMVQIGLNEFAAGVAAGKVML